MHDVINGKYEKQNNIVWLELKQYCVDNLT